MQHHMWGFESWRRPPNRFDQPKTPTETVYITVPEKLQVFAEYLNVGDSNTGRQLIRDVGGLDAIAAVLALFRSQSRTAAGEECQFPPKVTATPKPGLLTTSMQYNVCASSYVPHTRVPPPRDTFTPVAR